jgi:molecular chaperone DnaJ
MRDPYETLGVSRDASPDEIKSAYRRLARRYHPDVNPGDPSAEERFKEIGQAWQVLGDPDRKARFDRTGQTEDTPSDPFGGMGGGMGGNLGDLFDMFFGQMAGQGRRGPGRDGDDIQVGLELTLLDVVAGVKREVTVERMAECDACHGYGTEGGTRPETCPTCQGQGVVMAVRQTFIGQMRTTTECGACRGAGVRIENPCKSCQGKGVIRRQERVAVNVPPGFEHGQAVHIAGQGHDGVHGGRPGDLYVALAIRPDSRFERRGTDLLGRLPITFAQAALGDAIEVDGVDGSYDLDIPAGTQSGTLLRIKGAGLPPLHGGRRGDFALQTQVEVPKNLKDSEARLLREFAELRGERLPKEPTGGGFLGSLFGKKK